jgi:DNA-binding NarL/FixJ family response regulator
MTIRLLMADDQELFRSALAALLALRGQPAAHSGRHVPGDPFGPGTIPRS